MSYFDLDDGQYLIDAGAITSHTIQQQFNQLNMDGSNVSSTKGLDDDNGYRYSDVLNKAFKQYSSLGALMVKKDAAITFSTLGAIGLSLICINSLLVKLVFLAIAVILSFDLELQIPCASILLSVFVFRDSCMGITKAVVLLLSILVFVYSYWADSLINYSDIVWWMNILLVALWLWMLINSRHSSYYSKLIEFEGGADEKQLASDINYEDIDFY